MKRVLKWAAIIVGIVWLAWAMPWDAPAPEEVLVKAQDALAQEVYGRPWDYLSLKQQADLAKHPSITAAELAKAQASFDKPVEKLDLSRQAKSSEAIKEALPPAVQEEMRRIGQTVSGVEVSINIGGRAYPLGEGRYQAYQQAAEKIVPGVLSLLLTEGKVYQSSDDKAKGQMIEDAQSISHRYLRALLKDDKPFSSLETKLYEDIAIGVQAKAYERTLPRWKDYNLEQQKTLEKGFAYMRDLMDKMPERMPDKQKRALYQMQQAADSGEKTVINAMSRILANPQAAANPEIKKLHQQWPQIERYYGKLDMEDLQAEYDLTPLVQYGP